MQSLYNKLQSLYNKLPTAVRAGIEAPPSAALFFATAIFHIRVISRRV